MKKEPSRERIKRGMKREREREKDKKTRKRGRACAFEGV